jgi:cell division septum initiation protein DivIVA
MYVLNVQQKKKDLVDEVRELREKVAELEANKSVAVNTTIQVNNSDLEEAKVNAEYWEKECRRY